MPTGRRSPTSMRKAIELHIESLRAHGERVPRPSAAAASYPAHSEPDIRRAQRCQGPIPATAWRDALPSLEPWTSHCRLPSAAAVSWPPPQFRDRGDWETEIALDASETTRRDEAVDLEMQRELSQLSTRGCLVIAKGSRHYVQDARPDLVLKSVERLVQSADSGVAASDLCDGIR